MTVVSDPDHGRRSEQQDIGATFDITIKPTVEPMNVADLQFWIEDNPDRERGYWRYCWVSRRTLRCEFYGKYTSRACENALDRLWPEYFVKNEK